MVKLLSSVVLFSLLVPVNLSFADVQSSEGIKIYSGCLHHYSLKRTVPFWRVLFSPTFPKHEVIIHDRQCLIKFQSPIAFAHQDVTEVPKELTYFISFKNTNGDLSAEYVTDKEAFKKFVINIYTDDEQEYSIDPASEDRQISLNEEHHIFDSYIIYLILSSKIDHIDVVSESGQNHDKYVLDKFEIPNGKF